MILAYRCKMNTILKTLNRYKKNKILKYFGRGWYPTHRNLVCEIFNFESISKEIENKILNKYFKILF